MPTEGTGKIRRALDAPWDDLRERRVLERVLDVRRADRRARGRNVALWAGAGLGVAGAIAAAAVLLLGRGDDAGRETHVATSAAHAGHRRGEPAVMTWTEGSRAVLSSGAHVDVEVELEDLLRLSQPRGEVRYDVARRPSRSFVVRVRDVEVRVLGTMFTVRAEPAAVLVSVQRGHVEVRHANRRVELLRGDSLRVSTAEPSSVLAAQDDGDRPLVLPEEPDQADDHGRDRDRRGHARSRRARGGGEATSVESLLEQADLARREHRFDDAAASLHRVMSSHSHDPRVASALFMLGRVERSRGRQESAARAFAACYARARRGPLAEDALAEQAASWASARENARARSAARAYLARFPSGTHVARMRTIAP